MFVTRKKYSVPGWPETRWMNFLCLWRSVLWSRLPVTLILVLWNPQLVTCSTDPCFVRKWLAIQSPAFFKYYYIVVVHQYTCSSKLGVFIPCLLYQCSHSRLLYSLKENVLLCPLEVIKLLMFSNSRSFQEEGWWLFLFFSINISQSELVQQLGFRLALGWGLRFKKSCDKYFYPHCNTLGWLAICCVCWIKNTSHLVLNLKIRHPLGVLHCGLTWSIARLITTTLPI